MIACSERPRHLCRVRLGAPKSRTRTSSRVQILVKQLQRDVARVKIVPLCQMGRRSRLLRGVEPSTPKRSGLARRPIAAHPQPPGARRHAHCIAVCISRRCLVAVLVWSTFCRDRALPISAWFRSGLQPPSGAARDAMDQLFFRNGLRGGSGTPAGRSRSLSPLPQAPRGAQARRRRGTLQPLPRNENGPRSPARDS